LAIDGCHKTPHNLGDNDRNQKFLGLELIMRSSDQVIRFLENAKNPPKPKVLGPDGRPVPPKSQHDELADRKLGPP